LDFHSLLIANIIFSAEFLALMVVEILTLKIVFFVAFAKRLQEALAKAYKKTICNARLERTARLAS
jgi:hypothetical protein